MSSNGQLNGDIAEYPSTEASSSPYHVLDQYHSKRPRIRIASVGAGASGLCLAYKAERILKPGTWDLVLYEKNPHLGGTWWENTYVNKPVVYTSRLPLLTSFIARSCLRHSLAPLYV